MVSIKIKDFARTVDRLEESVEVKKTKMSRDSAILRFQLCFDLSWKTIKEYAKKQGIECYSPRECFKTAFELGLIEHDTVWLDIIDDRNDIIHTYKEEIAEEIYGKLKDYLVLFKDLLEKLQKDNAA